MQTRSDKQVLRSTEWQAGPSVEKVPYSKRGFFMEGVQGDEIYGVGGYLGVLYTKVRQLCNGVYTGWGLYRLDFIMLSCWCIYSNKQGYLVALKRGEYRIVGDCTEDETTMEEYVASFALKKVKSRDWKLTLLSACRWMGKAAMLFKRAGQAMHSYSTAVGCVWYALKGRYTLARAAWKKYNTMFNSLASKYISLQYQFHSCLMFSDYCGMSSSVMTDLLRTSLTKFVTVKIWKPS